MKKEPLLLKKADKDKLKMQFPLWSLNKKETELSRTFTTTSHIDALVLIARITVHAQVLNHHPDITFTYCKVKVVLTSHDVKGLTKQDLNLAKQIDTLAVRG